MPWTLVATLILSGCYLHHERPNDVDASGFDANVRDASHADADHRDATHEDANRVDAQFDGGDGGVHDGAAPDAEVDAGPQVGCIVPDDYLTLQLALDDTTCATILIRGEVAQTGTSLVQRDVTITSLRGSMGALRGDETSSVLAIAQGTVVTIDHLVVSHGGGARGAGIDSQGDLTLSSANITMNHAIGNDVCGGGIAQSGGSLHIRGSSRVSGNRIESINAAGGGLCADDTRVTIDGAVYFGGEVVIASGRALGGSISLRNSTFVATAGLAITDNRVVANDGLAAGGAIYLIDSELTLTGPDIALRGNEVEAFGAVPVATGGAIGCEASRVQLTNIIASGNSAFASTLSAEHTSRATGGFMTGVRCDVALNHTDLIENSTLLYVPDRTIGIGAGGALHCSGPSNWRLTNVYARNNKVLVGVDMDAAPPLNDPSPDPGSHARGGAIMSIGCDMTIASSTISTNEAEISSQGARRGAAIDSACGGALAMTESHVVPSLVSFANVWNGNRADAWTSGFGIGSGGAVCLYGHGAPGFEAHFVNSTFSGNSAEARATMLAPRALVASGGALSIEDRGAGPMRATFHNTTLANNEARGLQTSGGAIGRQGVARESVVIENSIVWHNTLEPDSVLNTCNDDITSRGFNFVAPTCFAPPLMSDRESNPGIGPIVVDPSDVRAYVHPLTSSSAAVNAGNPNGCTDHNGDLITTDQRGLPRNGRCDVGAYELQ